MNRRSDLAVGVRGVFDEQVALAIMIGVSIVPLVFQDHLTRSGGTDQLDGDA